jgi:Fe2+ or Zn2+ uptake regulation protein
MARPARPRFSSLELSPHAAARVRAALEESGCRYTHHRAAVYAYLEQVDCHPTADDVYQAVRQAIPHVSLATVYKALEALVAAGLASKLSNADGSARYDCRADDHYHLRDVRTGEIRDLNVPYDGELLSKLDPKLVASLSQQGFEVLGYRLEVLGRFAE